MYLLIYFTVYLILVFFLRSLLLWRKTGVNPVTFSSTDDAHGYNGKIFTFISIVEMVVLVIYAFIPTWRDILLPIWYIEHPTLRIIGWVFLIGSLLLVWVAQSQMSESWRIGIDTNHKTNLVTTGLFSYSRNPIFLGIMIANFGLLLSLPTAFTLLIVALSTVSINTQIRLEEEWLEGSHGEEYIQYKKKVRRWI